MGTGGLGWEQAPLQTHTAGGDLEGLGTQAARLRWAQSPEPGKLERPETASERQVSPQLGSEVGLVSLCLAGHG